MNKLQKVIGNLEDISNTLSKGGTFPIEGITHNKAKEALAELKEFMERLESEELVEEVGRAIQKADFVVGKDKWIKLTGQAAINVIKDKKT